MSDAPLEDFNARVMADLRNGVDRPGGMFDAEALVILHTVGARTGQPRETPVASVPDGDRILLVASAGGAPEDPAWYRNLVANPEVGIERRRGSQVETVPARATPAEGAERDRLWQHVTRVAPGFADYARQTTRTIPVVVVEPTG